MCISTYDGSNADVMQSRYPTRVRLVDIVAKAKLTRPVVAPSKYLAIVKQCHRTGLPTRHLRTSFIYDTRGNLSWSRLVGSGTTANLATIILTPSKNLPIRGQDHGMVRSSSKLNDSTTSNVHRHKGRHSSLSCSSIS